MSFSTKSGNNLKITPDGRKDHSSVKHKGSRPEDKHGQHRGKKLERYFGKRILPNRSNEHGKSRITTKRKVIQKTLETRGSGEKQTHLHRTRGDPEEEAEPTSDEGGQSSRWHTREGQVT